MNLNYFTNIPFASNDPSIDQPNMQTNTNSISAWVDIDHYGFKDAQNLGGLHTQVTMPVLAGLPARLLSTSAILYTKNVPVYTATPQSSNNLFFTAGTSAKEYQLTRAINNNTQFNLFGVNTVGYATPTAPVTSLNGGWTFLPGGLLLQYGFCNYAPTFTGNLFNVVFPIEFTVNPYSITTSVTGITNSASPTISVIDGTVTTTGFTVRLRLFDLPGLNPASNSFSWMAIGT